eukprot:jgi/Ulvmu1/1896/UM012_0054.1
MGFDTSPRFISSNALGVDTERACAPWAVSGDVCAYVQTAVCQTGTGYIPYLQLYYCWLPGWTLGNHVVLLLWASVMMLMLTVVVDRFFRPALDEIGAFLGLSEDGLGATILSLSNGVPHLIKQLNSVEAGSSSLLAAALSLGSHRGGAARAASIPLAIAWPVAGGVLTTNATLAAVAFVSAVGDRSRARCRCGALVDPRHFMRDVAFFAAALALTSVVLWHGRVNLWLALLLLALYLLYLLLFVSCQHRRPPSEHSVHSALLVARYQSLHHSLLSSGATWRSYSFGAPPAFPPSCSSSSGSQASLPQRTAAHRSAATAAPAATAAHSWARPDHVNLPATVNLQAGRSVHSSETLPATPRFGTPGATARAAQQRNSSGRSSAASNAAIGAHAAAQDALGRSFAKAPAALRDSLSEWHRSVQHGVASSPSVQVLSGARRASHAAGSAASSSASSRGATSDIPAGASASMSAVARSHSSGTHPSGHAVGSHGGRCSAEGANAGRVSRRSGQAGSSSGSSGSRGNSRGHGNPGSLSSASSHHSFSSANVGRSNSWTLSDIDPGSRRNSRDGGARPNAAPQPPAASPRPPPALRSVAAAPPPSSPPSRPASCRRREGAGAVAEVQHAQRAQQPDAHDSLPIVVPYEPSVFDPTAPLPSPAHYSHISVDLSSVRFPSCHTPVDGTSCCGCDPPSTQRGTTITSAPSSSTPASPTRSTIANRFWACIAPPLATVARCFMPELSAAESDPLAPLFTAMLPVTIPLFAVTVLRLSFYSGAPLSTLTVLYGTGCSLFSSILLYTVYPPPGTADGDRRVCFALLALCMSRLWMFLLAAETSDVFSALGRIHGGVLQPPSDLLTSGITMSPTGGVGVLAQAAQHGSGVLSATVLEWIEKAPDFLTNVGIAAAGMPAAAVAGCFGTAIFSMAAGTGVLLLRETVWHGAVAWEATPIPWVAVAFAAVSTARHAVLTPFLHRWRITWGSAIGMLLFYAVYETVYTWVCI